MRVVPTAEEILRQVEEELRRTGNPAIIAFVERNHVPMLWKIQEIRRRWVFRTPGTNLTYSTLTEWISGWRELARRPASSKKYEQQQAHLDGLPDKFLIESDLAELRGILTEVQPPKGQRADHPTTKLIDLLDRACHQRRA